MSHGTTVKEAEDRLRDALGSYALACAEDNIDPRRYIEDVKRLAQEALDREEQRAWEEIKEVLLNAGGSHQ